MAQHRSVHHAQVSAQSVLINFSIFGLMMNTILSHVHVYTCDHTLIIH